MANDTEKALSDIGVIIITELVMNMRKYNRIATGQTIQQIEMDLVSPTRMQILGPAYVTALEAGRRKTGSAGPTDVQTYGGISFKDRIKLWVAARGIEPKAWYPIYRAINKKGYVGSPGVITDVLGDNNIDKILNENLDGIANLYALQVLNLFK